ncbi:MAG: aspartate 1-decarboxylase [Planctomycetota bacterium]
MLRHMLRAKIHRATVTGARLDYVGSITIDRTVMEAAGIVENERVLVADLANGSRHETYAIAGQPGSGTICINGAAAHLARPGDKVIIMCFGLLDERDLADHRPMILLMSENNTIDKIL